MAIYIGAIAVETTSILTAAKIAAKAAHKNAVRGTVTVDGKRHRWSTIQQYEYHNGFSYRDVATELVNVADTGEGKAG